MAIKCLPCESFPMCLESSNVTGVCPCDHRLSARMTGVCQCDHHVFARVAVCCGSVIALTCIAAGCGARGYTLGFGFTAPLAVKSQGQKICST